MVFGEEGLRHLIQRLFVRPRDGRQIGLALSPEVEEPSFGREFAVFSEDLKLRVIVRIDSFELLHSEQSRLARGVPF